MTQDKLKIFISYSRKDCAAFAEDLVAGLELLGFDPFLDLHDIAAGEDWEERLGGLIQASDTVVYLISPASMSSEMCSWEVAKTVQMGKRLIPLMVLPVDEADVPRTLKKRNYIFFDKPHTFARALGELSHALKTDYGWIREHTRLSELANRWVKREKLEAQLLRGAALEEANHWMGDWKTGAPDIPDSVRKFIQSSSEAQTKRANKQRQQLEEIADAQAERALALTQQELAVKSLSRRTTMGLIGAGSLTVLSGGLAYWGTDAERRVRLNKKKAEQAAAKALEDAIQKEVKRTDIEGQINAYAASPGQLASDGEEGDKNSPYTRQLLIELSNPNAPLITACTRASQKVRLRLQKLKFEQTPFLSTDMNGQLYLQRQRESRRESQRRIALVVAVDNGFLKNVHLDAAAWQIFLENQCGFEVRSLKNPTKAEFTHALNHATFPELKKQTSLAHPYLHKVSIGPGLTPRPVQKEPPQDTLLMLVFAGNGNSKKGKNYIISAGDFQQNIQKEIRLAPNMMSLPEIQAKMRLNAAASILVLDTNFAILEEEFTVPDLNFYEYSSPPPKGYKPRSRSRTR